MFTRFSVINDNIEGDSEGEERRLLLGLDKAKIFEAGYVYEAYEVLDTIVIKKVGKYALPSKGFPSECSDINTQVYYGEHLITKEEKTRAIQQ